MIRNYIRIGIRNLGRHKVHAFINIAGLSLGMACCLLLFLLIRHEWSYDRFHEQADNLYRTTIPYEAPDGSQSYQNMMFPEFTPQLAAEFPTIAKATRLVQGTQDIAVGNESYRTRLLEVDAPFFEIFSFPVLAGDPGSALADPGSIVITEDVAETWFGARADSYSDVIGKSVSITRNEVVYDFTISAVAERPPSNSSIDFEAAISFENYDNLRLGGNNWGGRTSTYVLLADGTTAGDLEAALVPFVNVQFADYQQELRDNAFLADGEDAFRMKLQPIVEMHRQPDVWTPYETNPQDPIYSLILAGIGLLILIIACINFTTLTIGRSNTRQREVGMRKVLGARRGQLLGQFWGEAMMLTVVSLVLAVALAWLALPLFNSVTNANLSMAMVPPLELVIALLAFIVIVGLVAGGYPAMVLSQFQPVAVLKGQALAGGKQGLTRGLVVLQYTISIGLMIGTLIMASQLSHIANKDLGYDKDLVMVVNAGQVSRLEADGVIERLKSRLQSDNRITAVARSGQTFNRGSDRNTWTDENGITRQAYNFGVGFDYIDLMEMQIAEGRNFSRDFPSDSTRSILVNEALVREFGIEDPVGKTMTNWLDFVYEESPIIIGVVSDFNYLSLRQEVEPAVINMHPDYYNYFQALLVKIQPGDVDGAIAGVEEAWTQLLPGRPFTYTFLDEDLAQSYQDDQRWTAIVRYSSILAIIIACLGMFGLATISVSRRTKEIGVRKVLGASVPGVLRLLTSEFAWLIGIASIFAFPLAYYGMNEWLSGFASRVEISAGVFILSAVMALTVAMVTISYHALKAATSDPVRALRYE
jgi:putative ABC transport system permease protein